MKNHPPPKRVTLRWLQLTNFQGHKEVDVALGGEDAAIRATNAAGKTTLATAYSWLITGKDKHGAADFAIKTLGDDGEPLHNLEHAVEAEFDVDGEPLTLRRAYSEVWTKKRGSRTASFTGHETKFWIDGVPVKKNEYEKAVGDTLPVDHWRDLTDPDAWHARHWSERRRMLIDISGDVTTEEVIAANRRLKDLPDILGKRTPDEHRKVVSERRKLLNDELRTLPARIDETTRLLADADTRGASDLLGLDVDAIRADLADATAAVNAARGDDPNARRRARRAQVQYRLDEMRRAATRELLAEQQEARRAVDHARRDLTDAEERLAQRQRRVDEAAGDVAQRSAAVDELRQAYRTAKVTLPPIDEVDDVCPTCHQPLRDDQLEAARAEAAAARNEAHARTLAQIARDGQEARDRRTTAEGALQTARAAVERQEEGIADLRAAVVDAEAAHDDLTRRVAPAYLPGDADEADALTTELRTLQDDVDAAPVDVDTSEVDRLTDMLDRALAARATAQQAETVKRRLADLQTREEELNAEYETTDHELHLLDLYTREQSRMLTERINDHFQMTAFQLFVEQVNEGLRDACIATVDGVPYASGLNRASEINSGLDVLDVLQRHHGVRLPVFVDEAESVVKPLPIDTQVIRLIVDARHPTLDVEREEKEMVA